MGRQIAGPKDRWQSAPAENQYLGAGHAGVSKRYNFLKGAALEFAFILDVSGIRE
jgi:hypothetical protein